MQNLALFLCLESANVVAMWCLLLIVWPAVVHWFWYCLMCSASIPHRLRALDHQWLRVQGHPHAFVLHCMYLVCHGCCRPDGIMCVAAGTHYGPGISTIYQMSLSPSGGQAHKRRWWHTGILVALLPSILAFQQQVLCRQSLFVLLVWEHAPASAWRGYSHSYSTHCGRAQCAVYNAASPVEHNAAWGLLRPGRQAQALCSKGMSLLLHTTKTAAFDCSRSRAEWFELLLTKPYPGASAVGVPNPCYSAQLSELFGLGFCRPWISSMPRAACHLCC